MEFDYIVTRKHLVLVSDPQTQRDSHALKLCQQFSFLLWTWPAWCSECIFLCYASGPAAALVGQLCLHAAPSPDWTTQQKGGSDGGRGGDRQRWTGWQPSVGTGLWHPGCGGWRGGWWSKKTTEEAWKHWSCTWTSNNLFSGHLKTVIQIGPLHWSQSAILSVILIEILSQWPRANLEVSPPKSGMSEFTLEPDILLVLLPQFSFPSLSSPLFFHLFHVFIFALGSCFLVFIFNINLSHSKGWSSHETYAEPDHSCRLLQCTVCVQADSISNLAVSPLLISAQKHATFDHDAATPKTRQHCYFIYMLHLP